MTARVLDRRAAAAHRLRIERARMTADLWQLVRLGAAPTTTSPGEPLARQSARRAKSLLGVVIDSAANLSRSAGTPKSKRPSKSKRSSAGNESSGSGTVSQQRQKPLATSTRTAATRAAATRVATTARPAATTVTSVPGPREPAGAARLESADGRVVRGATDRTELVDVMEIATGLASILRG